MSTALQLLAAAADTDHPMRAVGFTISRLLTVGAAIWAIVHCARTPRRRPPTQRSRDANTARPPELATTTPAPARVGTAARPISALPALRASTIRAGRADTRPLGATGPPQTAPTPGHGWPAAAHGPDSGNA